MFISKRSNGIYYLFYERAGKRTCTSTKTGIKKEALKFLIEFESRKKIPKQTFHFKLSEVISKILSIVKSDFTKSTYEKYYYAFRSFLRLVENKEIERYTPADIERFKELRLKEVSPVTVNIDLRTLKSAFNILIRLNYTCENNPFNSIKLIKDKQREKLSFDESEILILLGTIDDILLKRIVLFGLNSGCRISEILNVQWKDVNSKEGLILIRNKEDFRTKSGRNRKIPMNNALTELINEMLYTEGGFINFVEPESFLFTKKETKVDRTYITKLFKSYLRKAGLNEKYHFHCLRHTYITKLINSGVPVAFVKEIAGHSEIETTMNYVHSDFIEIKKAVNKI